MGSYVEYRGGILITKKVPKVMSTGKQCNHPKCSVDKHVEIDLKVVVCSSMSHG